MASRPSDPGAPAAERALLLHAVNLGDAPATGPADPVVLEDTLPQGITALGASGVAGYPYAEAPPVECAVEAGRTVSCVYEGSLAPYDQIEIRIRVELQSGGEGIEGQNRFAVRGGRASPATLERRLSVVSDAGLGIEEFELRPEEEGGVSETQAGSHPFQVTAAVRLTQTSEALPTAPPKDLRLRLPPGLLADVTAVSSCPIPRFLEETCPRESVVGVGTFTVNDRANFGVADFVAPIFNLEPPPGEPARFGSLLFGVPVTINSSLRADDYAAELSVGNLMENLGLLGATLTLWGVPEDPRHDDARGLECLMAARGVKGFSCRRLEASEPDAMLTMPTSCGDLPSVSVAEVTSWVDRLHPASATRSFPRMIGCSRLPIQPFATVAATRPSASSPSGLDLSLEARGVGLRNPDGLAESAAKRIEVLLPEGFTLNPSAANGLESCSRAGYEAETLLGDGCPDGSKIGAIAIASPVLPQPVTGSIYLGGESDERFGGSMGLYVVARNLPRGLLIKLQARLRLDPGSGRITVVADKLPLLPFSSLELTFPQGPRAPLATPPDCGVGVLETAFTPYADPAAIVASPTPLTISSGPAGDRCPGEARPFHPFFTAGTVSNAAARYSPLYVRLSRADGESDLAGFSLNLPPGISARLAGVATCSPAALSAAAGGTGAAEAATPSCPADSEIGRTLVGVGVGPDPSYVPGRLYLAGPYRGAPFSLAAVIPARLGPIDLGTIVRRFPLGIDPRTGQVSIEFEGAERLPSMLEGVALHLRDLRLYLDRESFAANPTSCAPMAINGTAYATDGSAVPLSERFQAADCAALRFKPSLSLRLSGGLGRNGHPGLRAIVRAGAREAHIAAAAFTLPPGELLDFHHVRGLCARGVAAASCPASSRVGRVRLRSPFLDQPLRGPIYLRVPVRGLPALVADLRAGRIHIVLRGHVGAPAGRLRVSFTRLPDLPLAEALVALDGGRRGLIVNSEPLCGQAARLEGTLAAHSGKIRRYRPRLPLAGSCGP